MPPGERPRLQVGGSEEGRGNGRAAEPGRGPAEARRGCAEPPRGPRLRRRRRRLPGGGVSPRTIPRPGRDSRLRPPGQLSAPAPRTSLAGPAPQPAGRGARGAPLRSPDLSPPRVGRVCAPASARVSAPLSPCPDKTARATLLDEEELELVRTYCTIMRTRALQFLFPSCGLLTGGVACILFTQFYSAHKK